MIVLVMDDSKETLDIARSLLSAAKLKPKDSRIILFSEDCLKNLTKSDVEQLVVIGHSQNYNYGDYNSQRFITVLDEARENAKLNKEDLHTMLCVGCELGLVTEPQKQSHIQLMANQFALKGYHHLTLSAFTNRGYSDGPAISQRVQINPKGGALVSVFNTPEKAAQGRVLYDKRRSIASRMDDLTKHFIFPFSAKWRELYRINEDLGRLNSEYEKLQEVIYATKDPIGALASDPGLHFRPKFDVEELNQLNDRLSDLQDMLAIQNSIYKSSDLNVSKEKTAARIENLTSQIDLLSNKISIIEQYLPPPTKSESRQAWQATSPAPREQKEESGLSAEEMKGCLEALRESAFLEEPEDDIQSSHKIGPQS